MDFLHYLNKIKVDSKMTHLRMSKKKNDKRKEENRFTSTRSLRNNLFCQCSFLPSRWTNNKYERFLLMWHFFSWFHFSSSCVPFPSVAVFSISMSSELKSNIPFCATIEPTQRRHCHLLLCFHFYCSQLSALATMQDRARKHWWQSQEL